MNITGIKEDDIVLIDKKGRRFHAVVRAKDKGTLTIAPIQPNISYFTATAREVVAHYRKSRQGSRSTRHLEVIE